MEVYYIESLLAAYGLTPPVSLFDLPGAAGSNNEVQGIHTGGGDFVWKTRQNRFGQPSFLYEHRLLAWLAQADLSFAVPVPIPTRLGFTECSILGEWGVLSLRLPGQLPTFGHLPKVEVEALGAALGELVHVLAAYPPAANPGLPPFAELARLHPLVPDPLHLTPPALGLPDTPPYNDVLAWWRENLAKLKPFLAEIYMALPRQVVHRDFDPSNALLEGGRVSAVLDFEFAGLDARALDLAVTLEFTMRMEDDDPWPRVQALCQGYRRWGRFTREEAEAIPWLIRLRDVAATVRRMGQGLAVEGVYANMRRIEGMRRTSEWLTEHGEQLVDEITGRLVD